MQKLVGAILATALIGTGCFKDSDSDLDASLGQSQSPEEALTARIAFRVNLADNKLVVFSNSEQLPTTYSIASATDSNYVQSNKDVHRTPEGVFSVDMLVQCPTWQTADAGSEPKWPKLTFDQFNKVVDAIGRKLPAPEDKGTWRLKKQPNSGIVGYSEPDDFREKRLALEHQDCLAMEQADRSSLCEWVPDHSGVVGFDKSEFDDKPVGQNAASFANSKVSEQQVRKAMLDVYNQFGFDKLKDEIKGCDSKNPYGQYRIQFDSQTKDGETVTFNLQGYNDEAKFTKLDTEGSRLGNGGVLIQKVSMKKLFRYAFDSLTRVTAETEQNRKALAAELASDKDPKESIFVKVPAGNQEIRVVIGTWSAGSEPMPPKPEPVEEEPEIPEEEKLVIENPLEEETVVHPKIVKKPKPDNTTASTADDGVREYPADSQTAFAAIKGCSGISVTQEDLQNALYCKFKSTIEVAQVYSKPELYTGTEPDTNWLYSIWKPAAETQAPGYFQVVGESQNGFRCAFQTSTGRSGWMLERRIGRCQ